ncbi:hypothetical protein NQ317_006930, partial [Molorchus minor]
MVSCSADIKTEVIRTLNEKYGRDLLDLGKCKELYKNLLDQKASIQKELDVTNTECLIGKSIKNGEDIVETVDDVVKKAQEVVQDIETDLDEINEVRKEAKRHFDKLNTLQCTLQYMRVVQHIEYLSEELVREFRKKDDEKCATLFANLTEISRNLADLPSSRFSQGGALQFKFDVTRNLIPLFFAVYRQPQQLFY